MNTNFVGRKEEVEILREALTSTEAEMVAVIGRRRVGKTFLIDTVYEQQMVFKITGNQTDLQKGQLQNFSYQLSEFMGITVPLRVPINWMEAFYLLINYLKTQVGDEKKVVFFDELPWLATHKSDFLDGLSYFWNTWAVRQNIVVVICGSAASWMIKKVVHHRGGLHNRITKRIFLAPFTLAETEHFFKSRNIYFERYQIVQIYMALGGIPHYLKAIKAGLSAVENVERICFSKNSLLRDEFSKLYHSLFSNADKHISVVRTLAEKRQGMTRKQIIERTKITNGGSIYRVLEELKHSGFISIYRPFGKRKKEKLYRLTDEYSLFYLDFMEGKEHEGRNVWHHLSQTQQYVSWSGYTFESVCMKHLPQIKKALNLDGVYSLSSSFYKRGTKDAQGVQIDFLIDRNDETINLFEIKFYKEAFTLTRAYADKLKQKMQLFKAATKTKKQLFWVFISPFGLKPNIHTAQIIAKDLTMDILFVP